MNGLFSSRPCAGAIRAIVGGFTLQLIPALLAARSTAIDGALRTITLLVACLALGALVAAIVGEPADLTPYWKKRRDR
ncbi:MAG: hypothetical protein J7498_01600 [Sphingobium sp.]|nr:hypothetical protein [Sphingobium sp.]